MFRRILVVLDGSDDARAAFVFATDWSRHFDSQLWFIQLTQESHRARGRSSPMSAGAAGNGPTSSQ